MTSVGSYAEDLISRFWAFREERFAGRGHLFDQAVRRGARPPVFARGEESHNVLVAREYSAELRHHVLGALPVSERHRWFGSLKSSQALTQSVFANLAALGKLDLLRGLDGEDGGPIFFERAPELRDVHLEHLVDHLGEPRPTSVDVLIGGSHPVAIECKLAETEIGACSRPLLRPPAPNYARDHCDGSYTIQRGRRARCSLTEIGVRYWEYVPGLFRWRADQDLEPCPMRFSYQLMRNVLAACVAPGGRIHPDRGHAVLIYDSRNPAFATGGAADRQWHAVREALYDHRQLRRCSWQRLIGALEGDEALEWLVRDLGAKYGLVCR